jgi:hypothetical protein
VKVFQGDAFQYEDGKKYNAIWFDICDIISDQNLEDMKKLKSRYRTVAPVRICWAEQECKRIEREGAKFAKAIAGLQ